MKRILVLALAVILAVSSLAVPSYAAENDSGWIEVLDYASVNNIGNFFAFSGSYNLQLPLPTYSQLYYLDIVFSNTGSIVNNLLSGWNGNLTSISITEIGNGLYRACGSIPVYNYSVIDLWFGASATANVTLHSVRVSTVPLDPFYMGVSAYLAADTTWKNFSYSPGSTADVTVTLPTSPTDYSFSSGFKFADWRKFDYIDLSLSFYNAASINSIVARLDYSNGDVGGTYIDIDTSFIAPSFYNDGYYEVVVHIDLSAVPKVEDYIPVLLIDGEIGGDYVSLIINECRGFVLTNVVEPEVHWLKKIFNSVSAGFDSVVSWFRDTYNAMVSGFDRLVAAFSGEGDSEGFKDQVSDQGDKLDDMQGVMDSVTQPALDSINTDLTGIVSAQDTANIAEVYTSVIGDGFMVQIMTMVAVMAMISYAFFGKR